MDKSKRMIGMAIPLLLIIGALVSKRPVFPA